MSDLQFQRPPKTYRKVKTVGVRLSDLRGVVKNYDVTVYMHSGGTPTFAVPVPHEYLNAWDNHRHAEYDRSWTGTYNFHDGFMHAASFESVVEQLGKISDNYRRHYESITIRKVIQINLELKTKELHHRPPSFCGSRTLVGLRFDAYWEVNGQLYIDDRGYIFNDDVPALSSSEPKYEELRPLGKSTSGTVIPFTDAAWATLVEVDATLRRAAQMLHQLTDNDTAPLLLEGGATALLGHTKEHA